MTSVAGLDIGATTIRGAVADERGRLRATATEPTPRDRAGIVGTIQTVLRGVADDAGVPLDSMLAVGIGTMGPLDHEAGVVMNPPNVPGVESIAVVDTVADVYDGPVVFENDAVAAAIGEQHFVEDSPENLVYLTLSTGIGVGAIVDGHVLRGASGNAAEIGHVTVAPDSDRRCGCGARGHWEAFCSGRAIPETARRLSEEEDVETSLDLETLSSPNLFDAVGTDPLADRVIERLAAYNAIGVATAVHAYDPSVVHIGGSVATNNPETVVDPIRRLLPDHLVGDPPDVSVTPLGSDAVLRGAVASAIRATGEN